MKKIFLLFIAAFGLSFIASAQEISENAIGLRLADSDAFGAEITYQRAIGENNRLEFDLGVRSRNSYNGFKLAGLYQWVWNIDGAFNWYAGAGGGVGTYRNDDVVILGVRTTGDSNAYLFAAGDVGIEYSFDIPLLVSLDVRPEFSSRKDGNNTNLNLDFDIGLSVRYQF